MLRSEIGVLLTGLAFAALPHAALAADYGDDGLRGSYDWAEPNQYEDAVGFEAGLRYIYSYGEHDMTAGGNSYAIEDKSHVIEAHLRVDDLSTSTFLRGSAGLAVNSTGGYATPATGATSFEGGTVASLDADFGWYAMSYGNTKTGLYVGYGYRNESPDMGWTAVAGARTKNAIDINALRLGITSRAAFSEGFDISLDGAVVPFATIGGTYGAYNGGAASIDGSLYGLEGQVMLGYHFTPEAVMRIGVRGSYLAGQAGLTRAGVTTQTSNLTFSRVGAIAELTASF